MRDPWIGFHALYSYRSKDLHDDNFYHKWFIKAIKSGVENIHEMLFYLRNNYSPHTEERAFIEDIPQDDRFSFEEISDYLKTFCTSIREVENMSLKNKVLLGGWISTEAKVFKRDKNLRGKHPGRFEDSMFKECKIKKQLIFNYKNLYKLMRIAPKLLNYRVNMTYFVKNHNILFNHFQENEKQTPWKHNVYCDCETCNSYFTKHTMTS